MSSSSNGTGPDDRQDPSSDREELEKQIEETRAELADAVEALAYKADVKARARDKAGQLKQQARATAGQLGESAQAAGQVAGEKAQFAGQRAQEVGRSPQGQKAGALGLGLVVIAVVAWLVARRRS